MKRELKAAFPHTIPVMLGYVFVGIAFGLLYEKAGYNFIWAVLMSVVVYAGSMQFVAISFFAGGYGLLEIAILTLFVNARQIFYGLSFLDKFSRMGKKKAYMIFSLTDETYSLLCSTKAPENVDRNRFMFCIALLNQIYWIIGSAIGSFAGAIITFNTAGIDFAMTALFIVIFIEQWKSNKTHIPALVGAACSIAALILFGQSNLILPSMFLIILTLMLARKPVEKKLYIANEGECT